MTTRADYQKKRFQFIEKNIKLSISHGLEIGACDLPTVSSIHGTCQYADFRSHEEMSRLWNININDVTPVDYILKRNAEVSDQIKNQKFDYAILCHVIEHVPNPIGYINDIHKILNPGGIIMITCPDKRATFDSTRISTSIEHLLMDYYNKSDYPSLEHILDFSKAAITDLNDKSIKQPKDFYDWACKNYESGEADAHCHVWTDHEFFSQINYFISGGFIENMIIHDTINNAAPFNEFMMILKSTKK